MKYGIWHVAYAIFSPTDMRQTSIFTEIRFLTLPQLSFGLSAGQISYNS